MLRKHLPLIALILVFIAIFLTNFSFSKFLIGWDNLLPELNFGLNIKRAIFSVWQEYQGLGLLAGNGHAADLPRMVFLYILSLISPLNFIRQIYIFLMLFIGPLGTYFLIRNLFNKSSLVSFIGSLFYLLNLITVQTFYAPFEPMITQYGFLPWLILSLVYFLKNDTKKALILFIIVNVLSIPQGEVPTVFLVYLIIVAFTLFILNFRDRSKKLLKKSVKALGIIFVINSFWLLPFLYFVITNSGVAFNAKINQMATQTVILQDKASGNITDVMLLKGFWFNNVDPDLNGKFVYMMSQWRDQISNILVFPIGYLFFAVILIGFVTSLKKINAIITVFAALFVFSFTMLCTNTPPFSFIDSILRLIPIFDQVFRFPFTKFSIVALLTYSVFFSIGVYEIYSFLEKRLGKKAIFSYLIVTAFSVAIVFYMFPIFKGQLFYYKEKLSLPNEYLQTFNYLQKNDQNQRISNLPQPIFWGWSYYNWGFGGSGFIWYGINQPILDRAFDVWSSSSENYYWELSNAIYSKNPILLKNVLNKYQIGILLVDKNLIYPSSPQTLMISETQKLISQISQIKKSASFGNIDIYKVNLNDKITNFVYSTPKLPVSNEYNWGNYDKAYENLGNYITTNNNINNYFPFRSLFSNKDQKNQEYSVKENNSNIEFSAKLTNTDFVAKLDILPITAEKIIYAQIIQNKTANGTIVVSLLIKTPEVYLTQGSSTKQTKIKIWGEEKLKPLFIISQKNDYGYYINVNGVRSYKVEPFVFEGALGSTFLSTNQDNVIVFSNSSLKVSQSFTLKKEDLINLFSKNEVILPKVTNQDVITVSIPKINDNYANFIFNPDQESLKSIKNCDNFNKGPFKEEIIDQNGKKVLQLSSTDSTACFSPYSSTLSHSQGYAAFVDSANIKGRPLHFWLLNEDQKFAPIDTYLSDKKTTNNFIIPPQEQFGLSYSFHFDNISIGENQTINTLGQIRVYPIPYNFLSSLVLVKSQKVNTKSTQRLSVNHPNFSLYNIKISSQSKSAFTLVVSQAFDNGWQAYKIDNSSGFSHFLNEYFPFVFGQRIQSHVLINNWENGWILDREKDTNLNITIIYLPQYLEFLGGFMIILALILAIIIYSKRLNSGSKV